jgi:AcrR family transcriptional regulator
MTSEPPPHVTAKTGYHHGDLRAQLIAAVADLVELHGPEGFSVSEAARRAGVSTAAPYKHFRDRGEILRGVVSAAMDRLHEDMETAAGRFPEGSLESVAAIGQAYVDFARTSPGVFRLTFGLTEGHEDAPELQEKGRDCFGVVAHAAALHLGLPVEAVEVQRRAYLLWCFVHGHAFLTIDRKNTEKAALMNDWDLVFAVARGILETARPH